MIEFWRCQNTVRTFLQTSIYSRNHQDYVVYDLYLRRIDRDNDAHGTSIKLSK